MIYDRNMSSSLRTQAVADQPKILIIGDDSVLSLALAFICQQHDFQVNYLELGKKSDQVLLEALKFSDYYRVILATLSLQYLSESLVQSIKATPAPLLTFFGFASPLESSQLPSFSQWLTFDQQVLSLVSKFQARSAKTRQVLLLDFVAREQITIPFVALFANLRQNKLLDPKIELFPFNQLDLKPELQKLVFAPFSQELILFKGKRINSTKLLGDFSHEVYGQKQVEYLLQAFPHAVGRLPKVDQEIIINSDYKAVLADLVALSSKQELLSNSLLRKEVQVLKTIEAPTSELAQKPVKNKLAGVVQPNQPIKKIETTKAAVLPLDEQLEKEIQEVFQIKRVKEKTVQATKKIVKTKQIKEKSQRKRGFFLLTLFFGGILTGLISLGLIFWLNMGLLKGINEQALTQFGQVGVASPKKSLIWLQKSLVLQLQVYRQILPAKILMSSQAELTLSQSLSELFLFEAAQKTQTNLLLTHIFSVPKKSSQELSLIQTQLHLNLEEQLAALSRLELILAKNQVNLPQKNLLVKQKQALELVLPLIDNLNLLLGVEDHKTYALLIQNNFLLSPTGGAIQVVYLLDFTDGQLSSAQAYDVAEIEVKLKGQRLASAEQKQVLNKDSLSLQDGLWAADFGDNAQEITTQLESVFARKIDGVFALNLIVLQKLLNNQAEAQNLFEQVFFHAETELAAKMSKKSYLLNLSEEFLANLRKNFSVEVLSTLGQSFAQKQLVGYLANSQALPLKWQGKLVNPECPAYLNNNECLTEGIYPVELNIGGNFVNRFVTRETRHQITLLSNKVQHSHVLTLKNEAQSKAWPSGSYRTYLRFYVPIHAQLRHVFVNGQQVEASQILIDSQTNFQSWGLMLEVPPAGKTVLNLEYETPLPASISAYGFLVQKQPGTGDDNLQIVIQHSPSKTPVLVAPQAEIEQNQVKFNLIQNEDQFVLLQLQ